MLEPVTLTRRSPLEGRLSSVGASEAAGVIVQERTELQIATVIARTAQGEFASRVQSAYGLELTAGSRHTAAERIAFVGTGPRTWLAIREGREPLAEELQLELGDAAAISDQSDSYTVVRLSGTKARATFEKGLSIDLHPRAFHSGRAAVTACSHLGVILWQLDEMPTYEVAVFRSLAAEFAHWLSESAAEFGLKVLSPERG